MGTINPTHSVILVCGFMFQSGSPWNGGLPSVSGREFCDVLYDDMTSDPPARLSWLQLPLCCHSRPPLHRRHFLHPSISVSACLPVSFFRRLCARVTVLCLLVHVSDVRRCLHRHREAAYPQPRRLDKQQTVITYTRHRAALI